MSFGHVTMKVNGEDVSIDIEADLGIGDLSLSMERAAAQMGFWGEVWAAAEAEKERVDAHYRRWRAQQGEAILAADSKVAEWKVKQAIEADPKFIQYKESIAKSIHNATLSKSLYESFKTKASILQSKGAMARAEREASGMTTKSSGGERHERPTPEESERRVSSMKEAFAKKKST